MLGFRHRIERAAELDDVPIAVIPVVQQRKIIPDFVDRHRVPRSIPRPYIGSETAESDIAGSKRELFPGLIQGDDGGAPCHSTCMSSGVSVSRGAASTSEASALSMPPIEPV